MTKFFSLLSSFKLLVASVLICAPVSTALAQSALESFFKNPRIGTASLSPNGKFLATTATINGVLQLAVVETETGVAKNIAGYEKLDIHRIRWINDERIVFDVIDRGSEYSSSSYGGLYAINRDGSRSAAIMHTHEHKRQTYQDFLQTPQHMQMVAVTKDDPNSIIALGYFFSGDVVPYRVDTLTERRKEISFNVPGRARGFVFDRTNALRVVVTSNISESELVVWYRENAEQSWKKLSEHSSIQPKFTVLGFDADNTTMLVSAPVAGGMEGVHKFDFVANRPGELLAADKSVDVAGGLVFSPDTQKLLGVRMASEPPRTQWIDPGYVTLQSGIDRAFPGLVNVIHPSNPQMPMLIHSYSSTHPGNYSLYHVDKKKLQNLLAVRPAIEPKKMSEQRIFDYVARDGLPITSYLTLPKEREAKSLPLVVYPHGGPFARDYWGFDPVVQFLAGLGYAVLQPQFRGSTGLGSELYRKGFRQWGLAMQDDLADGVNSLIKQGLADPARVCIMGNSYGGYAAMMGLIRDPNLYKCGINLLGPTNLNYMFTEGRWRREAAAEYFFKQTIGDPDAMREQFTATSPAKQADKVRAPVLMVYGENDSRVPVIHGYDMRAALKKHDKVHEWILLEKEEHGISSEENRFKVYGAIEGFLRKYNPAK